MFEQKTPEQIKAEVLGRIVSNLDTREGSYTNDLISPVALEIFNVRSEMGQALDAAFPGENSGKYLDMRCSDYNIVRKDGAKATAKMIFAGDDGTIVPKGKIFLTKGNLEFAMTADCVIEGGQGQGEAVAAEIGAQYNVNAGEITMQYVNLQGISAVTSEAASGGIDAESDKSLYQRLDDFRKTPIASGNKNHYKMWAKEARGVGDAKVTPLAAGPGTVGILIVGQDMQPVSPEIVANCAAHIEELRPIGAAVTVTSAQARTIDIAATVTLESAAKIDDIKAELVARLDEYLKKIAFAQYSLLYNRIAFMILDTPGVIDYTQLTINGGTDNIIIEPGEVPALGRVALDI